MIGSIIANYIYLRPGIKKANIKKVFFSFLLVLNFLNCVGVGVGVGVGVLQEESRGQK